jgi:hypothetical protein
MPFGNNPYPDTQPTWKPPNLPDMILAECEDNASSVVNWNGFNIGSKSKRKKTIKQIQLSKFNPEL